MFSHHFTTWPQTSIVNLGAGNVTQGKVTRWDWKYEMMWIKRQCASVRCFRLLAKFQSVWRKRRSPSSCISLLYSVTTGHSTRPYVFGREMKDETETATALFEWTAGFNGRLMQGWNGLWILRKSSLHARIEWVSGFKKVFPSCKDRMGYGF